MKPFLKELDGYEVGFYLNVNIETHECEKVIFLRGGLDPAEVLPADTFAEAWRLLDVLKEVFDVIFVATHFRANPDKVSTLSCDDLWSSIDKFNWISDQTDWDVRGEVLEEVTIAAEIAFAEIQRQGWQPLPPRNPGFVYLLQSPTSAYKIGRTKNPDDRLKTFGVKLPFEVEYVCLIKTADMGALEAELHGYFADKRINGEWFNLTPDDVAQIKEMAT